MKHRNPEEARLLKSRTIRDRVVTKDNAHLLESPLRNLQNGKSLEQTAQKQTNLPLSSHTDYAQETNVTYPLLTLKQVGKSKLDHALEYIAIVLSEITPLLEKNKAIQSILNEIDVDEDFSPQEVQHYREQFEYNAERIKGITCLVRERIIEAKRLWEEKQRKMKSIFDRGLLDNKTSLAWSASLDKASEQIQKYSELVK
jgi:hypothetical protein